ESLPSLHSGHHSSECTTCFQRSYSPRSACCQLDPHSADLSEIPKPRGVNAGTTTTMDRGPSTTDREHRVRHWLGKLTKLNPASGRSPCHGKAPHKPLLLLTILDMVEDGEFTARSFTRTAG